MLKQTFISIVLVILLAISCSSPTQKKQKLIIFHAGSLTVPIHQIADKFMKGNPDVEIITEAAGSRKCARKITDLKKECDIMASADYSVIDQLLIPDYADWNIKFASNEMAIVYNDKSKYASEINANNWYDILNKEEVIFGRSDPNADPCGYRAVLTMKLSDIYYKKPISETLLQKNTNYIRPKETDLLALLESHNIDYIFLYRSVAMQHGLNYLSLPDEINLKNTSYTDTYHQAEIQINGKKPGEFITKKGEPMVYGITLIKNSKNKELATKFIDFLLNKSTGMKIMEQNGQPSVIPSKATNYDSIPETLKKYAIK